MAARSHPAPDPSHRLADKAFQLGLSLHRSAQRAEAVRQYRAALALHRDHVGALHNLGQILIDQGTVAEGIALIRRALVRNPASPDAHNTLGMGLYADGRYADAAGAYRKALVLRPDYPEAHYNLGAAYEALGAADAALIHYSKAADARPQNANAHHRMGIVQEQLGEFAAARAAFETAVSLQPDRAEFHFSLAENDRFVADDPRLKRLEALADHGPALTTDDRVHVNFALGKAYADLGDQTRSFRHYLEGNAIKRQAINYDAAAELEFLQRVARHFAPALLDQYKGSGVNSRAPVFILGMPRSGTTLVEQILASHPMVCGAGELRHFGRLMAPLGRYPELTASMSAERLRSLGLQYVQAIHGIAGKAVIRITDKMPMNFALVGLIHLALPNASIIHVRRDPIDCCVSNFTRLFAHDLLPFTYDLTELGRYYRAYEQLMAHWEQVLPGVMLDVRYEELVADIEAQSRQIIAYCGLDWHDNCLRFHETKRPVQTASVKQVRQPLYHSAVGRWRRYGALLEPLLRELDASEARD